VSHCRVAASSALSQTIGNVEVIVVADGDAEIAPMPGVTLLQSTGEKTGPAHTRNRGIDVARGQFISFLDSDDYYLPRGLEHLLRAYSTGRHGYIYGNAFTFERDGSYQLRGAPDYVQANMANYNIHVITTLIPTHQVRQVGGMDERGDAWEDWRFHLRLAQAGICGYRTDQPIFVYRVWEGDRMTRFYPNRETMEPVWKDYRNEQGVIPMAGCCGGDATLAQVAGQAVQGALEPEPVSIEGGLVRVKYVGDEKGSIPFDFGGGVLIRLGDNPTRRYADVTPAQAAWLKERLPIEIVPKSDPPMPPPEPLPIALSGDDAPKALRPKRAAS
jgi:glycosyl transferase family 2